VAKSPGAYLFGFLVHVQGLDKLLYPVCGTLELGLVGSPIGLVASIKSLFGLLCFGTI
jgi:hypothetical protein